MYEIILWNRPGLKWKEYYIFWNESEAFAKGIVTSDLLVTQDSIYIFPDRLMKHGNDGKD